MEEIASSRSIKRIVYSNTIVNSDDVRFDGFYLELLYCWEKGFQLLHLLFSLFTKSVSNQKFEPFQRRSVHWYRLQTKKNLKRSMDVEWVYWKVYRIIVCSGDSVLFHNDANGDNFERSKWNLSKFIVWSCVGIPTAIH